MITSVEIRRLEFNKKMNGYDINEVRSALESIAKEMENLTRENIALTEQVKLSEERLNHFRLIEKTLQDSVITMQITLDEKRRGAEQAAELIIQEARHKAAGEIREISEKSRKLREEIEMLDQQRQNYYVRFRSFCKSQLDWLDSMEKGQG
jgi:cell division initiation protein